MRSERATPENFMDFWTGPAFYPTFYPGYSVNFQDYPGISRVTPGISRFTPGISSVFQVHAGYFQCFPGYSNLTGHQPPHTPPPLPQNNFQLVFQDLEYPGIPWNSWKYPEIPGNTWNTLEWTWKTPEYPGVNLEKPGIPWSEPGKTWNEPGKTWSDPEYPGKHLSQLPQTPPPHPQNKFLLVFQVPGKTRNTLEIPGKTRKNMEIPGNTWNRLE